MTKRGLGMMIVLYLFTFGIYPIIWWCKFQQELKNTTGEGFNWLGHLLMTMFTFGIYAIYWYYAAGKRLAKAGAEDRAVIYLVVALVGFAWVQPFVMQDQANKLAV